MKSCGTRGGMYRPGRFLLDHEGFAGCWTHAICQKRVFEQEEIIFMNEATTSDHKLVVVINGDSVVEYDRGRELPPQQLDYLNRMDQLMDNGISIGSNSVDAPDLVQRATFVANNLIEALRADDESIMAAACAYLANRLPDLKQVKAEDRGEQTTVELIFDKPYKPEVKVNLT